MLLLLLACATPGDGAPAALHVTSLRVEPATAALSTREGAPATQAFEAIATFGDGSEAPLDLVSWTSSSVSAGAVDGDGVFTAPETNGGQTTITATHAGIAATAEVTVVYTDDLVEEGVDAAVAESFAAASATDDGSLALAYPPDGVNVPRNLEGLTFAWTPPDGAVSRLHLTSATTDVSVYTDAATWTAGAELWAGIVAANRQGTVTAQVETGTWDGAALTDVRAGPAIDVTVNRLDASGSILYWDAAQQAIMRIPFGSTEPTRFWPVTQDGTCVGCHSLSESVGKMVVTHDGVNGVFTIVDVNDPAAPERVVASRDDRRMTFKTLSPDGRYMLGVLSGALSVWDLATGAPIGGIDTEGYRVTHPDWSPDGRRVALVRMTGSMNSDMAFTGGEIVLYDWDGQALANGTVLVPRQSGVNVYYPAWSPDGEWLAYNRSTGDAYADEDAEVWLVSADGAVNVRLDAANGEGDELNSYPRWAPLSDDDVMWLAFSSGRGYPVAPGTEPQIWVTAIDTALATQGADPSRPAFWLPGQDDQANNHLPVWWSR